MLCAESSLVHALIAAQLPLGALCYALIAKHTYIEAKGHASNQKRLLMSLSAGEISTLLTRIPRQ